MAQRVTQGVTQRDGRRGRDVRGGEDVQRQSDYMTLQILLTALLIGAVWISRLFFPDVFETVRRIGEDVLTGNESMADELFSSLSPAEWDLELILRERFGIDISPVTGFLARFGIGKPDYPATLGASGDADPAMGGVPRGVDVSPLLLSAKPRAPLTGEVTSRFGWRENPLAPGAEDFHTGLDIAAPAGSVIYAALPGVVGDVGHSESYGNYVLVDHENGLQTFYCHCEETIARAGEHIRQGERVALVGSTGYATGPHLHFEIRRDTLSCDPLVQLL